MRLHLPLATSIACLTLGMTLPASADFSFSTGNPDGKIATGSRPSSTGKIEIESADDFNLGSETRLTSATFTGLLPTGLPLSSVGDVRVEIYRVFPADSDVGRTSGPPTFSTPQVPTRVNSPSDVAFDSREVSSGTLSFTTTTLQSSFTAANSVLNGIHLLGGEGPVTGQEVRFNINFKTPFDLPADHYFFVPQVEITGGATAGDFLWLSAPRPIVAPGTPFMPDLQAWIRNENLQPDWLRIGTDIIGGATPPTFNMAFSLEGQAVPEPSSMISMGIGCLLATGYACRYRRKRSKLT